MNKSESIVNIAKSICDFQGKMEKIAKDSTNPFFKNRYASLSTILENIQVPLNECKLAVSQFPENDDELTTILMHSESGEFLSATYKIHPVKSDPQSLGSAITYARRYALSAILGLNIEEDDDGNNASNLKQKGNSSNTAGQAASQPNTNTLPWLNPDTEKWNEAVKYLNGGGLIGAIEAKYRISKPNREKLIEAASQPA